jgi:DNA gyrase/topoisomerase IV subunit B
VDALLSWADFKQSKDLKKTDGAKTQRIRGIVKLEDANDAGGRNSEKCTLILTEGDSAKALLAVSGCTLSLIVYIQILIEKLIFQILV